MSTPSASGIPIWNTGDAPYIPAFSGALATALDLKFGELGIQFYEWADSGERNAELGMRAGAIGYQRDNDTTYRYHSTGTPGWDVWSKPLVSVTPTLQNFGSLGVGGTSALQWMIDGGVCHWWIDIVLGTSPAVGQSNWGFTLPTPMRSTMNSRNRKVGEGVYRDLSVASTSAAGNVDLWAMYNTDTGFVGFRQPYSGSAGIADYGYLAGTQTGIPTFQVGDYVTASGEYLV